jgi:hypothetical protein
MSEARPERNLRFARNASAKLEVDEAPAPTVASGDGATRGYFPLEASVRRGWGESAKRSSASVGADAPFRGIGVVPPRRVWRLLLGDSSSAGLVALSMIGAALGARSAPGADYCFDQRVSEESAST